MRQHKRDDGYPEAQDDQRQGAPDYQANEAVLLPKVQESTA
jgi:hypothetical protein